MACVDVLLELKGIQKPHLAEVPPAAHPSEIVLPPELLAEMERLS